jgi:hypothetical protein
MVAIPNQQFRNRDPGLAQTPEAIETFLYLACCSNGVVNELASYNDLPAAQDALGQGELAELVTAHASEAGGPVLAMRLTPDVVGTIGAVTKHPVGSSTGTIAVTVTPQNASKAWMIDDPAGTPVYVDETVDLSDADASDVQLFPATEVSGDQFAIGFTSPFAKLAWVIGTLGVGGTVAWKYWNGTAWTTVTGLTDTTTGFTASPGTVTFTMPTDWKRRSLNGSAELYYLVAEITGAYGTNPLATSMTIDQYGPHDKYVASVRIKETGTLGAGMFDYSLDDEYDFSPELTIPSGGSYDIPNTGLRVTFTAGGGPTFFEDGDKFTFETVAPFFSTTALAAAFTAIGLSTADFAAIVLGGRPASAAAGATLFASFGTQLSTLELAHRPPAGIMDSGIDTAAATKTAYAAASHYRIMPCFTEDSATSADKCHVTSAKPFTGWSAPRKSIIHVVAPRAAASLISTHLGRFADGTLTRVKAIGYNEEKGTAAMSAARFCTLRTWTGFEGGYYINRPNLMSPPGSDYDLWPHLRMRDVAHTTGHRALQRFMNSKVRVRVDGANAGKILDKEALRIEGEVNAALATNLTVPDDAEGNQGHLAAVAYRVNREHNVASTNRVEGQIVMVRDGYAEEIITTIGFTAIPV